MNIEWKDFKNNPPTYDNDNHYFLVTDMKNVYVAFNEKGSFYFMSETYENEYEVEKRLVGWIDLDDVLQSINKVKLTPHKSECLCSMCITRHLENNCTFGTVDRDCECNIK